LLPVVALDFATFGPVRLVRATRGMLAHDMRAALPRVTARSLVVRGSRDVFASERWCEEVAALLRAGPLEVVARGAHATQWSNPVEVARLVRGFVGR